MYGRRRAREVALQLLFQRDLNPTIDRAIVESFVKNRLGDSESCQACLGLFDAIKGRAEEIDSLLSAASDNWKMSRMAAVDRNVLRLGAMELLQGETPPPIVINEAIELARRFGTADSPTFVNGVLDRVHKSLKPSVQ
jgi:N utilization substance protein B